MSVPKPAGPYVTEMTDGGGWPEVSEDTLNGRADQLMDSLRQVISVLEAWLHEESDLFVTGAWSGSAATAAGAKVAETVNSLHSQQMSLATAALWYRFASAKVVAAKVAVTSNVESAQAVIKAIEATAEINPDAQSEIDEVISDARGINISTVSDAALATATGSFHPPAVDVQKLINQAGQSQTMPASKAQSPSTGAGLRTGLVAPRRGSMGSNPVHPSSRGIVADSTGGAMQTATPPASQSLSAPSANSSRQSDSAGGASETATPAASQSLSTPVDNSGKPGDSSGGASQTSTPAAPPGPSTIANPDPSSAAPGSGSPGTGANSLAAPMSPAGGASSSGGSSPSSAGSGLSGLSSGSGSSQSAGSSPAGGGQAPSAGSTPASGSAGGSQSGAGGGGQGQQTGAGAGGGGSAPASTPPIAPAAASAAASAARWAAVRGGTRPGKRAAAAS